jgi:hypothetical protein
LNFLTCDYAALYEVAIYADQKWQNVGNLMRINSVIESQILRFILNTFCSFNPILPSSTGWVSSLDLHTFCFCLHHNHPSPNPSYLSPGYLQYPPSHHGLHCCLCSMCTGLKPVSKCATFLLAESLLVSFPLPRTSFHPFLPSHLHINIPLQARPHSQKESLSEILNNHHL